VDAICKLCLKCVSVDRSPSSGASGSALQADDDGNLYVVDDAEYAPDSGEFENDPIYNADVLRESDRTDCADFPEQGITRDLLAKFQHAQ